MGWTAGAVATIEDGSGRRELGLRTGGRDDGEGAASGQDGVEDRFYLWGHGYAVYDADCGPVCGLYETVLALVRRTAAPGPAVIVVHGEFRV